MKSDQITHRALNRLPQAEAHELDSELARSPELAAELRATEDAITSVWHAVSPLHPAPAGALDAIHAKLHPVRSRPALPIALAVLGWAAAIMLALLLFSRPKEAPPAVANSSNISAKTPSNISTRDISPRLDKPLAEPDSQRETILRLREELATLRALKSGPRIRELRAPGDTSHTHPTDRNRALLELLTAALGETLARQSESQATLVVEDGWLASDFANLPEDGVIRHRAFPDENFSDYGLLRSANGDFYDPASGLLWSPALDGGGYLGRLAPSNLDLASFDGTPPPAPPAERRGSKDEPTETKASPSGYLVQSEEDGSSTIIIGNLPYDGTTPDLVASNDGGQTTIPLTATGLWPGSNGTVFGSFIVEDESGVFLGPSSLGGGTMIDLEFIQRRLDGSHTTILTTSP